MISSALGSFLSFDFLVSSLSEVDVFAALFPGSPAMSPPAAVSVISSTLQR